MASTPQEQQVEPVGEDAIAAQGSGIRLDEAGTASAGIDTTTPHPARMYDYFLGGYDNYEVDRAAAERVLELYPEGRRAARECRAFLGRAVRFIAGQGVRQFLDLGTGVPTAPNVHEIAREIEPGARVAYVDNDPIVRVHAQARLTNAGGTSFVQADLREPQAILEHPQVRSVLDFEQPVGLLLCSVMHFVRDDEDPAGIVATLRDALPAGSHVAITNITLDPAPEQNRSDIIEAGAVYDESTAGVVARDRAGFEALFAGFELVEPGAVLISDWRPDRTPLPGELAQDPSVYIYAGVGRKD
ncbi:MAG TPA: SAM-dependent methyltransferase [Actinocrinis sp.]|jgi:hypothetical protein